MPDVFLSPDYRAYLKSWISNQPNRGRGSVSTLARAARCQPAYFSRVLSEKAQLSPEQGFAIQKVLGHSIEETQFFMLLLDWDRAGDSALKHFYANKIEREREARTDLRKRFKDAPTLSREHQVTYYGSAHYVAIHTCISISSLQTVDAVAKFLNIPRERTLEVLNFLAETGLAIEEKGRWRIGQNRLHLGRNSDLIRNHHSNWRIEAIKSLDRGKGAQGGESLHYSAVVTLSQADVVRLKEHFIRSLEEFSQIVAASPEETARAITLDFFSLD